MIGSEWIGHARDKRDEYYKYWKKAVTRTFDWFD